MPRNETIPQTVAEVLDDRFRVSPEALRAVKALARSKPWRGSADERLAKFNDAARALCEAYGMEPVKVIRSGRSGGPAMGVIVDTAARTIAYPADQDYMSVVTLLHVFSHLRGLSVRRCFAWSVNMFRRCFPLSFGRCIHVGPFLFSPARAALFGVREGMSLEDLSERQIRDIEGRQE